MTSQGETAAITGRWRFATAAGGWGVRGRLETTIEGVGTLDEDELVGYDRAGGLVHLMSMNTLAIRDHRGRVGLSAGAVGLTRLTLFA